MKRPRRTPHDLLFQFTFARSEHAARWLQSVLPRRWAKRLDWSTLTPCRDRLVDRQLQPHAPDAVFTIRTRRGRRLVYLVIEHKAAPDRRAGLQVLRYGQRILELHEGPRGARGRVPLVIPVVLHHGPRPWPHGTDVADLIDARGFEPADGLPAIPLRFGFLLDDLAAQTETGLLRRRLPALPQLTLLFLQFVRGADDAIVAARLRRWAPLLRRLAASTDAQAGLEALSSYLLSTTDLPAAEAEALFAETAGPTARESTMSTADKIASKARREGKEEGLTQGLTQGITQGRRDQLLRLLARRFGPLDDAATARVQRATAAELDRWTDAVFDASSLAALLAD